VKGPSKNQSDRYVISLFSGAMGLDIGLEKAGFKVVFANDVDETMVNTIKQNFRELPTFCKDVRDLTADEVLSVTGLKKGEPFLVSGGPPCQPYSTAGLRLSIKDPRGSLFMDYVRLIAGLQPRFFIMENVVGLTNARIKHVPWEERNRKDLLPEEEKGSAFKVVLKEFEKLGYEIVWGVLNAVDYGVPQFRERLFILGSRDHEGLFLPKPTHFQIHQEKQYRWRTLGDAIKHLEDEPGECATFTEHRLEYLRLVPPGGNWRDLPQELLPKAMGGAYKSDGGKTGFYRRLSYDEPSPTLVTSPIHKSTCLCHPKYDRPLSVREYLAIQQFPDDYVLSGSLAEKYKQIGNAVPVGLAEAVGKSILAVAEGSYIVNTKRMRVREEGGNYECYAESN